ncbi:DNA adenine methylase [Aquisphaera insulae]|uniref:DNA adenine methylase n=1 Tax=Aquisphaera insulae TaxID=2712864 RepID=UPI0013EACCCE|nr:Dam family site-specific DNA-(adenine-N6)-methyltransferase [Aquisphaera insulae]
MTKRRARPFVKWAGGKQAIASVLVGMFPGRYGCHYEPFLGGGSVLFAARPEVAVCGDQNEWLLGCYAAIRDDWPRVAGVLDVLPNTREDYLRIRAVRPGTLDPFTRAAHFIYLNKTCFRGLFRVNRENQFNVPYGAYDRRYYDPNELAAVAEALRNIEFRSGDFERSLAGIRPGDFAYLDPPYYKLGGYSDFNRYTQGRFREDDHARLASVCRELDARGVLWAVSNSDTPFVRRLFDGYAMIPVSNRREINLDPRERDITELLIVNYEVKINQDDRCPGIREGAER